MTDTNKQDLTGVLRAFQEHRPALRRFISRLVRRSHDIDDVAQEAFLRAYQAEQTRDVDIEQPKSFLFRVAHNIAITDLQRKSSQIMDYIAEVDDVPSSAVDFSPEEELMAHQLVGIHCEAVAQLPAQCRRVYLMRKVHGMSHREIAERLGISHRTVEKHISKGVRDCCRYVSLRESGAGVGRGVVKRALQREALIMDKVHKFSSAGEIEEQAADWLARLDGDDAPSEEVRAALKSLDMPQPGP